MRVNDCMSSPEKALYLHTKHRFPIGRASFPSGPHDSFEHALSFHHTRGDATAHKGTRLPGSEFYRFHSILKSKAHLKKQRHRTVPIPSLCPPAIQSRHSGQCAARPQLTMRHRPLFPSPVLIYPEHKAFYFASIKEWGGREKTVIEQGFWGGRRESESG